MSIQLSLDVVDRLQQDVMRGFGAVPRRGAEVGGILMGGVAGAGPVVRVDDYELIPIEYKHGPSYRFSPDDLQAFQAALHRLRNGGVPGPIGYFRSHTRGGAGLCGEDLELLSSYFPEPESIALLIRPFAARPGVGGFYFKEAGAFQTGAPLLEFPFRRRDLAPGDVPDPKSREHSRTGTSAAREIVRSVAPRTAEVDTALPATARSRRTWPVLAIILLLAGVLLGYQAALTIRPRSPAPYNLALTLTQSGDALQLKWDPRSQPIGSAQKGMLLIEDGAHSKTVTLTTAELESGRAASYRPLTKHVSFRLDVFQTPRNSISETIEWRIP